MLKIVLCDDNITFLNKLEAKISSYLSLKELSFNIVKYTSPEVLINNMADKIDIIFLDVILTTLIISKKPVNTGKSRDRATEFTTKLLLLK